MKTDFWFTQLPGIPEDRVFPDRFSIMQDQELRSHGITLKPCRMDKGEWSRGSRIFDTLSGPLHQILWSLRQI